MIRFIRTNKPLQIAIVLMLCLAFAWQAEAATRRILLAGDSWPMFMWSGIWLITFWEGRAFQDTLIEKGYGQWEEWGEYTAIGTSMATEWRDNLINPHAGMGRVDAVIHELEQNPTIDIIHLSLGGNDYGRGDYTDRIDYLQWGMQSIIFNGDPTGGTFTLTFNGQTTDPIPFNSDPAVVESALEALSTIGAGNISVIDAEGIPRYFCTFQGALAHTAVPMMSASGSGLTGDGNESVSLYGVKFDHGWERNWGTNSPAEFILFDAIAGQVRYVIERCLDVRPNIRVALCDYDLMNDDRGGAEFPEVNVAGMRLGMRKFLMTQSVSADPRYLNRCFYVAPGGLMQYAFGYPYPVPPGEEQIYGPNGAPGTGGTIAKPKSNLVKWGISMPEMGGDTAYPSPDYVLLFEIGTGDPNTAEHLNKAGYWELARYCIDEFYGEWLDLPVVLSVRRSTPDPIEPWRTFNPTGLGQVAFEVTFSTAVSGVDEADFAPVMHGGLANASIASVTETKDGATYEVVVNTGSGDGTLTLGVVDNGSIRDAQSRLLAGDIDGSFSYGQTYTINRASTLPVAALPVLLMVLGAGMLALRRKP